MCIDTASESKPVEALEIKLLRRRLGWSQRRLAAELGVSNTYVSHAEADRGDWTVGKRTRVRFRALEKRVHDATVWPERQRLIVFAKFKLPKEIAVLVRPRKCRGHKRYCLFRTPRQRYCGDECKRLWKERRKRK